MFAYYCPPLNGEPWLAIDDARLLDDFDWGCSAFTMAKRARRSEEEIEARLAQLGRSFEQQPKPNRRRAWTG